MPRAQGYVIWLGADGSVKERDTIQCAHCQRVVAIEPNGGPVTTGWCGRCARAICAKCAADGRCVPFEKKIEQMEAHDRFCRSIGL